MKKFLASSVLVLSMAAGTLSIATTAMASGASSKFASSLQIPSQATPVRVEVSLGENLAYRADNLSKDIKDRHGSRSLNNGFANNGYFGQKDLDRLVARLKSKTEARLAKNGIPVTSDATTVLKLVLTDARPNRPTFKQLSKSPNLSFRSFSNGGASMTGTLHTASGEQGDVSYGWFERDIEHAQYSSTWSDARRAIDRFAHKTAKALK